MAGGENRGVSAGMIAVVLRNDDIARRLRGHRLNVLEQDARLWRVVAGVDDDDALSSHDRHGVGVV